MWVVVRAVTAAALLLVAFYAASIQLMGAEDIGRMIAGSQRELAGEGNGRKLQVPCDVSGEYTSNGQQGYSIDQTSSTIHINWPGVPAGFDGTVGSDCTGSVDFGTVDLTFDASTGSIFAFENGITFVKITSAPTPTPPVVATPAPTITTVVATPQPTTASSGTCDISGEYTYSGNSGYSIDQTGSSAHLNWPGSAGFSGTVASDCTGSFAGFPDFEFHPSTGELNFANGITFIGTSRTLAPTPPPTLAQTPAPTLPPTPEPTTLAATPTPTVVDTPAPTAAATPTPTFATDAPTPSQTPAPTERSPPTGVVETPEPTDAPPPAATPTPTWPVRDVFIEMKEDSYCLDARTRRAQVQDCDRASQDQQWSFTRKLKQVKEAGGKCLAMTRRSNGANIMLRGCDPSKPEQKWIFFKGMIKGGTTATKRLCVEAVKSRAGGKVKVKTCRNRRGQRWRFMSNVAGRVVEVEGEDDDTA